MILLTVGTQLPFDRLVRAVDAWVSENPGAEVFAQIGEASYQPSHFSSTAFLDPIDLSAMSAASDLIVSHAGMGSIISAFQCGKPIVVVPRRASLGEIRNDHQLATARRFVGRPGITVAFETHELPGILSRRDKLIGAQAFSTVADDRLIARIKSWLSGSC